MNLFTDLFRRLWRARLWVVGQLFGMPVLILLGVGWLLIPEKHGWQVLATVLSALLLAICLLELQAGTMRRLAENDGKRVRLVWGAASLLIWIAVGWAAWAILDWCDGQIPEWAGYLNSRMAADARATVFTYDHIQRWLTVIEWVLRWIVVPGKILPWAAASVQWGWRLPWGKTLRQLWNWRWWPAVAIAALLGQALPATFFDAEPHGTVPEQQWRIGLKLAGAYLLPMVSWLLLLAWAAVLAARQKEPAETGLDQQLFRRLAASRKWIWAWVGWPVPWIIAVFAVSLLPDNHIRQVLMSITLDYVPAVLLIAAFALWAITARSLMSGCTRRVRLVWGSLSVLAWVVLGAATLVLLNLYHCPAALMFLAWIVLPAVLVPFMAASAVWAFRLPWLRVSRMLLNWKWWLGSLVAVVLGAALPALIGAAFSGETGNEPLWCMVSRDSAEYALAIGSLLSLLAWFALLFDRQQKEPPPDDSVVAVPVLSGPPERELGAKAEVPPPNEGGTP